MDYLKFIANKAKFDPPTGLTDIPEINPMLFDFQRDIVKWALRRGRAAIWADCGMGKGPMALTYADHVPGDVLIVAPLAVSQQFMREAEKFGVSIGHAKHKDEITHRVTVTNYERLDGFDFSRFSGVVLDECFPKNTEIDVLSIDGLPATKYIQDVQVGDKIINAFGVDFVSDIHRREVQYAVRVKTARGTITSSPNHPYFTQRGWVGAIDLLPGDCLMETTEGMRLVQGYIHPEVNGTKIANVLRSILFSEVADETAGDPGESPLCGCRCEEGKEAVGVAQFSGRCCRSREDQKPQPHEQPRNTGEGEPPIEDHEPQTFRAWGERERVDRASAETLGCSVRGLDSGICFVTGRVETGVPDALQDGLGESRQENRNRGGWSLTPEQEASRREKGRHVGFVGVDSVEVLELGHPDMVGMRDAEGKLYFYDIGATRHPSYSVNGFLVHNSSILKAHDGKTRTALIEAFQKTPFRLACTATPAPNDHMELCNHAEFLGTMSRVEMLSMFFVHDGGDTAKWRLKGHAESEFWRWLASWAVMIRKPSDLGYDDSGFALPPMHMHQQTVEVETPTAGMLFAVEAQTLQERLQARRETITDRVQAAAAIVNATDRPFLVWCNLNAESEALTKAIPGAVEVKGADSIEHKERSMIDFAEGKIRVLVSKSSICGFGMNFQVCADMAFVGLSDSYEQFYQAVRRCWRFGQKNPVNVHIITAETEGAVVANIKRKEADAMRMADNMVEHMKGINSAEIHGATARQKAEYVRDVAAGDGWTAHLGDCVDVFSEMASDSLHYSIYSPPFASLYTYSNSDRDMGNCKNDAEFMGQYRFLVRELFRVTMPGRLTSFHCMNLPTSKERDGFIGIRDFRGDLIRMHVEEGWIFHSEVCIWKDPVTAMQRTKALGLLHKQIKKDSCMSRQGIPDYLVTMRKPGDNPERVGHTPDDFPVSLWQRYASPVWMDINPSDTLQYRSAREHNDERHICPLQLEVIRRAVKLWSNPGDLIGSPFMGIGSEGHVAIEMGRRFVGSELKRSYWEQSWKNLDAAKQQQEDLFA